MKQLLFPFLFLLSSTIINAQVYTVESVPNMKLINNSYVSNPDGILGDQAVKEINSLLDSLEKKATAQIAVVMLTSIGDEDVFDFAQKLFEKWGIGKSGNDNGLLILYIQDKRTIRFHTGYGLEGVLPDAICKRIQTQKMVPRFKEGNVNAGMVDGVIEVNRILTKPETIEEVKDSTTDNDISDRSAISILFALAWAIIGLIVFFVKLRSGFSNSKNFVVEGPHSRLSWGAWLWWYYFLLVGLAVYITYLEDPILFYGIAYGYPLFLSLHKYTRMISSANSWLKKGEFHSVYEYYQKNQGIVAFAVFFPLPFLFLIADFYRRKKAIRYYPRPCKNCNQVIQSPLSEATEDEYLPPEFIHEENIKSVDYDVWKCNSCNHVEFEVYVNKKTKYTQCPKCNTIALSVISTSTVQEPTTSSSGTREIIKQCSFCNKKTVERESIPMIVESTSSDSSSSSWSSSSSDSGGSWGGGDSGGGGASSSW